MGVIVTRESAAGISANTINQYKDISAQIDSGAGKATFAVGESFKNLRVIHNGRNQNQAIIDINYTLFEFTIDFVPNDGQHLAIIIDKP